MLLGDATNKCICGLRAHSLDRQTCTTLLPTSSIDICSCDVISLRISALSVVLQGLLLPLLVFFSTVICSC